MPPDPAPRFRVVDAEAASQYADYFGELSDDFDSYLVDTLERRVVFCDSMEPEDATLGRDLAPLVDLLNQLAARA